MGDIALSSAAGLPPGGLAASLSEVAPQLRDADVTIGNLEGTLSTTEGSKCAGATPGSCFAFQAPPSTARDLRALGFDLVNQANNHSLDFGENGRQQTLAALHQAGVQQTGLPGEITYRTVHGVQMAFLGFAPYPSTSNLLDISGAQAMIRAARKKAALVVVIIHAGAEGINATHTPRGTEYFLGEDRGDARRFAHSALRAGASIVLGSGPHVLRGIQRNGNRMIAYSLGDFVGYHTLATGGVLSESAILRVTLGPNGRVLGGRLIPITLGDDGIPHPDPADAPIAQVRDLSSADFPGHTFVIDPSGTIRAP